MHTTYRRWRLNSSTSIAMLICVLLACVWKPSKLQAFDLSLGLAAMEEGDDRLRPAAGLHIGFTPDYFMRAYVYGRTFGPVTERTQIVSANYRFGFYGSNKDTGLVANVGMSTLFEETTVAADPDSGDDDDVARQFNLGATFGAGYIFSLRAMQVSFNWDSHLYLAGAAGIFLSTARKQALSLLVGFKF